PACAWGRRGQVGHLQRRGIRAQLGHAFQQHGLHACNLLYFLNSARRRSCGSAITVRSSTPVIVSAPTSALMMASSLASMAALKSGVICALANICTGAIPSGGAAAFAFAVEKAIMMSPERFPPATAARRRPPHARRAMPLQR